MPEGAFSTINKRYLIDKIVLDQAIRDSMVKKDDNIGKGKLRKIVAIYERRKKVKEMNKAKREDYKSRKKE
ncbi:hypothetical protein RUND412_009020 [Rhizina undulata]